jgi:hypothetical protein
MRRRNELIFDELTGATSAAPAYTSDKFSLMLGEFDQLAIHVVIDKLSASVASNFELFIEHSADGRTWLAKNAPATPGDVQIAVALVNTTYFGWGSDPGSLVAIPTPFLGHVRLRMYFTVAVTAHVKVYVTQRDQGG